MRKVLFCDFDGTVALEDVGDRLFQTLAYDSWKEPVERWKRGEISSRECLEIECSGVRVSPREMEEFLRHFELDPTFPDFVRCCREEGIPLYILSDGLDFYIRYLLERYGLEDIPFFSNRLCFSDGRLVPEFPYFTPSCGMCGNCKVAHIRRLRRKGDLVVHIGDGLSDRFAAEEADVVFAKGELLEYCRNTGLSCRPFRDFRDVREALPELKGREVPEGRGRRCPEVPLLEGARPINR